MRHKEQTHGTTRTGVCAHTSDAYVCTPVEIRVYAHVCTDVSIDIDMP